MANSTADLKAARERAVAHLLNYTHESPNNNSYEVEGRAKRATAMLGIIAFLDEEIPRVSTEEVRYGKAL